MPAFPKELLSNLENEEEGEEGVTKPTPTHLTTKEEIAKENEAGKEKIDSENTESDYEEENPKSASQLLKHLHNLLRLLHMLHLQQLRKGKSKIRRSMS